MRNSLKGEALGALELVSCAWKADPEKIPRAAALRWQCRQVEYRPQSPSRLPESSHSPRLLRVDCGL